MELKRCTKCITPETHETIMFDEAGVCNVCSNIEFKDNNKKQNEGSDLLFLSVYLTSRFNYFK